jgi:hypothetical protein
MATKSVPFGAMTNALPIVDPRDLPGEREEVIDGMFQNPNILDTVTILEARYKDVPTVFVDAGTVICYNPENLNDRVFPDCYVAFDVPAGAIFAQNGYLIWQVGKAPDFALEVASESTARRDITFKRELYERIGVREYWRFDPSGGDYYGEPLAADRMAADRMLKGAHEPIELAVNNAGMLSGYSEVLGLWLCVEEGMHPFADHIRMNRLLFFDPEADEYLRNLAETGDTLAETEHALSETEHTLSETEQSLAAAQSRIRELEAKLRRRQSD